MQRRDDGRASTIGFHVMDSPFATADRVVMIPAIQIDFAVLHVQMPTPSGIIRIEGQAFADVVRALCVRKGIVTARQIVEDQELRILREQADPHEVFLN